MGKPYFVHIFSDLKNMNVTTSLPQKGRQPNGCIPLTPPVCNLVNLMRGNRNMGDDQAAGAEVRLKAPKSAMIYFYKVFSRV